jgi:hypothetical protein
MHVLVARISLHSNKILSLITTVVILETCTLQYSKHKIMASLFLIMACPRASLCYCDLHTTVRQLITIATASLKIKKCKVLKITLMTNSQH